eukprot:scaffold270546_cov50-Prasinocladus_malaysianus.AAC.1
MPWPKAVYKLHAVAKAACGSLDSEAFGCVRQNTPGRCLSMRDLATTRANNSRLDGSVAHGAAGREDERDRIWGGHGVPFHPQ